MLARDVCHTVAAVALIVSAAGHSQTAVSGIHSEGLVVHGLVAVWLRVSEREIVVPSEGFLNGFHFYFRRCQGDDASGA